jgi:hypothetical protein
VRGAWVWRKGRKRSLLLNLKGMEKGKKQAKKVG